MQKIISIGLVSFVLICQPPATAEQVKNLVPGEYLDSDEFLPTGCGKLKYPSLARRLDAEGTTVVIIGFDHAGKVIRASLAKNSGSTRGHKALDAAALEALSICRFPAKDGRPDKYVKQEVRWVLQKDE